MLCCIPMLSNADSLSLRAGTTTNPKPQYSMTPEAQSLGIWCPGKDSTINNFTKSTFNVFQSYSTKMLRFLAILSILSSCPTVYSVIFSSHTVLFSLMLGHLTTSGNMEQYLTEAMFKMYYLCIKMYKTILRFVIYFHCFLLLSLHYPTYFQYCSSP